MSKKINVRRSIGLPAVLRKSHAHKSRKDYDRKKLKGVDRIQDKYPDEVRAFNSFSKCS